MPNISLQKRLIDAREAAGMSQSEVARRIGLANSVISRIESGDRKVAASELADFADLYHVSADYLLGRTNLSDRMPSAQTSTTTDLSLFLQRDTSYQFNFEGVQLTPEQNMKLRIALTQIFWDEIKLNNN